MRSLNHSEDNLCTLPDTLTFRKRTNSLSFLHHLSSQPDSIWDDVICIAIQCQHERQLATGCCTDYSTTLMPKCKLIKDLSVLYYNHFHRFTFSKSFLDVADCKSIWWSIWWTASKWTAKCEPPFRDKVSLVNAIPSCNCQKDDHDRACHCLPQADCLFPCLWAFICPGHLLSLVAFALATKSLSPNAITLHCNDSINRRLLLESARCKAQSTSKFANP